MLLLTEKTKKRFFILKLKEKKIKCNIYFLMEVHVYFQCEKYKLSIFYESIIYFKVIYKKTYKKMIDKCIVVAENGIK